MYQNDWVWNQPNTPMVCFGGSWFQEIFISSNILNNNVSIEAHQRFFYY
jgi:hypothetical protein